MIHLVRAVYGLEQFKVFVDSFRSTAPGTDYELVLAMKGFASSVDASSYLTLCKGIDAETVLLPDEGFDLDVYFELARRLQRDRYCFLNSFSQILAPNWLANLDSALQAPNVGLVGATGSWASPKSWTLHRLRLPTPYRHIFPDRRHALDVLRTIRSEQTGQASPSLMRRSPKVTSRVRGIFEQIMYKESFPAPHIRTNAFMIRGIELSQMHFNRIRNKADTYRIEHGRRSLTKQVSALGLKTLVVDRFGTTYEPEQWPSSNTYAHRNQEGLMVSDNQTTLYQDGDRARRSVLGRMAWGIEPEMDPSPRGCRT